MTYDPNIHHRRSIRLKGYDYSQAGMYFVTLCAKDRECLFGRIDDSKMLLSDAGKVANQCWNDIPVHFPHAALDEFVIMPNHVHGIIVVGANNYSPLQPHGTSKTIGSIVRGFKIGVTKWMRANTPVHDVWQRNYWERVIRNDDELSAIREYIHNNPAQWELDKLHPNSSGVGAKYFSPLRCAEGT